MGGSQSGITVLMSPLGGYLIGFVIAAFVMGWLLEKGMANNIGCTLIVAIIGNVIIYSCGFGGVNVLFWLG